MSAHYQHKKRNPYLLPPYLYRRVLYTIKDYDRRKEEYQAILEGGVAGVVLASRSSGAGAKPTEHKATMLMQISDELHAVEQALMRIPREYRQGVFASIKYDVRYPETACYQTWQRWRQRYIYYAAVKLKLTPCEQ